MNFPSYGQLKAYEFRQRRFEYVTPRIGTNLLNTSAQRTLITTYKKAVLPQGNRAMPQVFFSVEVRQQHSLQV